MVVYTAVFGKYDTVRPPTDPGGARWVCFTDGPAAPGPWRTVTVPADDCGPRRTARRYKVLSHVWFRDDVAVWIDGNVQLKVAPEELLVHLEAADVAAVEHQREGHYAEAQACLDRGKGDPDRIRAQVEAYRERGCPPRPVLATFLLVRRHTPDVMALNEVWWSQVGLYSCRDQVSLPYCLWVAGMGAAYIPGTHHEGPDFRRFEHG